MPKKDFTQVAFDVMRQAIGDLPKEGPTSPRQEASRRGGVKGSASRSARLSPEERAEIARTAASARWKKSD